MEMNRLEAAVPITKLLSCAQDCVRCCGWSRSRSDCPQGAQSLGSVWEIGPEMRGAMGFHVENCTDKEGWSDGQQRQEHKPNSRGESDGGERFWGKCRGPDEKLHLSNWSCFRSAAGNYLWLAFNTPTKGSDVSWKFRIQHPQMGKLKGGPG